MLMTNLQCPFLFWQGSCNPRIQSAHDNKNYTLILKPRLIYFLILHVLVDCNILTPLTDSRNHHLWSKLHKYALLFWQHQISCISCKLWRQCLSICNIEVHLERETVWYMVTTWNWTIHTSNKAINLATGLWIN